AKRAANGRRRPCEEAHRVRDLPGHPSIRSRCPELANTDPARSVRCVGSWLARERERGRQTKRVERRRNTEGIRLQARMEVTATTSEPMRRHTPKAPDSPQHLIPHRIAP